MKAKHTASFVFAALVTVPGMHAQATPEPQQIQVQPAANQNPRSECASVPDPDAKIACLTKERERLLKMEQIKKMEQDNAAIGKEPATPLAADAPAKKTKKRTDCLMPGDKQKFLPEFMHGFYDVQRAKIIRDTKGQITPPTWAEIHMPLPPCPADPAIPVTAK